MSDLLPPQSTATERAIANATARIDAVPVPNSTLWTPETCPAAFLPWLAWSVSVDVWDTRWPEQVKRDVIAASIEMHRMKGTINGMRRAMAALGVDVTISEWWELGGQPYTFRILARPTIDLIGDPTLPFLSAELQEQIERVIRLVKPVRAHADIYLMLTMTAQVQFASIATVVNVNTVQADAQRLLHGPMTAASVAHVSATKIIDLNVSRIMQAPISAACVATITSTKHLEAAA